MCRGEEKKDILCETLNANPRQTYLLASLVRRGMWTVVGRTGTGTDYSKPMRLPRGLSRSEHGRCCKGESVLAVLPVRPHQVPSSFSFLSGLG